MDRFTALLCTLQYSTLSAPPRETGVMEAGQEVVTKDQVPSVPLMQPPATHSEIIFLDTKQGGHHFGPLRENNLFPALLRPPNH